jgi:hypothetical protein
MEFETQTFPWTWRFAAGVNVPTPTTEGPNTELVINAGALAEMLAMTTGAEMAFEAHRFPST